MPFFSQHSAAWWSDGKLVGTAAMGEWVKTLSSMFNILCTFIVSVTQVHGYKACVGAVGNSFRAKIKWLTVQTGLRNMLFPYF